MTGSGTVETMPRRRHSWPADVALTPVIRDTVHRWLGTLPLSDHDAAGVVVAVDAAVENAIKHAYRAVERGTVEVVLWTEPGMLCVEVADHGGWHPPTDSRSRRGIPLMKRLVESVIVRGDEQGTRVQLRHPLRDPLPDPLRDLLPATVPPG